MPLIIDGYNLIHGIGLLPASVRSRRYEPGRLSDARLGLLGILSRELNPVQRSQTTVVFDAIEPPEFLPDSFRHEGMRVYFARGYQDADEYIIEQINATNRNSTMTVVTSDHQIQKYANRKCFDVFDSDKWYYDGLPYKPDQKNKPSPGRKGKTQTANTSENDTGKPKDISEDEIEYWTNIFQ